MHSKARTFSIVRVWVGVAVVSLMAMFLFASRAIADNNTVNSDARMVSIYDRGVAQTIITKARTVRDALDQAKVSVSQLDIVEPALSESLIDKQYSINVYRARPVIIHDGNRETKTVTAAQTASSIAKAAKVTIYPEDKTELVRVDGMLENGGAGLKLVIDRAAVFTLIQYGKRVEGSRTQAATVGDMLKEKGIVLGANDGISVPASTPLTAGMTVSVWRNGKQTITQEEVVAKTSEEVKDAAREQGFREVRTPGEDGKKNVTYEIDMRNGQEVARKEIASVVTKQPVKEVVVVGTKSRVMPYTGGGSKTEWLRASGIPEDMWGYVDSIVQRESTWNPNATNSSSGACGLAQALPCSKVPGNPYDPVDSLRWMNSYVNGRYGGWEGAHAFWQRNHWY